MTNELVNDYYKLISENAIMINDIINGNRLINKQMKRNIREQINY